MNKHARTHHFPESRGFETSTCTHHRLQLLWTWSAGKAGSPEGPPAQGDRAIQNMLGDFGVIFRSDHSPFPFYHESG